MLAAATQQPPLAAPSAQQAAQPLTDEQIRWLVMSAEFPEGSLSTIGERQLYTIAGIVARAVERAHGIAAAPQQPPQE